MSRPSTPVLGTAALRSPTTQRLNVNEETCLNLSLFKSVMSEYRKLDDTVTLRMNRNGALFHEAARSGRSSTQDESEACLYFWRQLVANWKSRAEIIDYCVQVLDKQLVQKENMLRKVLDDGTSLSSPELFKPQSFDAEPWRGPTNDFYRPVRQGHLQQRQSGINGEANRTQGELTVQERQEIERRQRDRENDARNALWEEQVKRDQMTNEKTVEAIVRRRSYEAFRSRCKFFQPAPEDREARRWWDDVASLRNSRA